MGLFFLFYISFSYILFCFLYRRLAYLSLFFLIVFIESPFLYFYLSILLYYSLILFFLFLHHALRGNFYGFYRTFMILVFRCFFNFWTSKWTMSFWTFSLLWIKEETAADEVARGNCLQVVLQIKKWKFKTEIFW